MNLEDDSIYELLPAYHRLRDAQLGYPLRALARVLSRDGAQVVEADINAWQDALFVETCAESLLPRLAELVGAEKLRPLPPSAEVSMRAFIGNVLRYRRSKGTALTLELLARDVTAFTAKAVEFYARLSATLTVRAPRVDRHATAVLRDPEVRALHGGAFDRNSRVPDVRSIARARGRYNLPNVGVFLWRLDCQPYDAPEKDAPNSYTAHDLAGVPPTLPWEGHAGHFTLAPQARSLQMFAPARSREGVSPSLQDVPERLRRLPLWRELEARRAARALGRTPEQGWFASLEPFTVYLRRQGRTRFRRLPPEEILIGALVPDAAVPVPPWTRPAPTLNYSQADGTPKALPVSVVIDPATGRIVCTQPPAGETDVAELRVSYASGQPGELGGGAYDRGAPESVPSGALVYVVGAGPATPGTIQMPTLAAALAQWQTDGTGRRGFIVVTDNSVDLPNVMEPTLVLAMPRSSELDIVAADFRPPIGATPDVIGFLVRRSRRALLLRPLQVKATLVAGGPDAGKLKLDGVHCEAGIIVNARALRALSLRHAGLRPLDGVALKAAGHAREPMSVDIERSLCGALEIGTFVDRVSLRECVVTKSAAGSSIAATDSELELNRASVYGAIAAKSLEASDSILLAPTTITRQQIGCIRYSYVDPQGSKLPRRYRCQPDLAIEARVQALGRLLTPDELRAETLRVLPVFIDNDPDEPAFAMLGLDAPREIACGAEGDTEMGAYGYTGNALRVANLTDLFVDYLPLGLEASPIGADRANNDALRRNQP